MRNERHNPERLEPAATVIAKLGGEDNAMEATGASRTRVRRWCWSRGRGGTDGLIPSRHHQPMLDWAKKHKKPLGPEDFFVVAKGRRRVRPKLRVPRKEAPELAA